MRVRPCRRSAAPPPTMETSSSPPPTATSSPPTSPVPQSPPARAWNQSAGGNDLGGSIGFYGRPERSLGLIGKMQDPLLLLVAGADFTPQEAFHDFDRRLSEANVPHEMHIYDGAPHSFFDRTFAEWKDYCDDAWRRMLGFIANNSKVSSST